MSLHIRDIVNFFNRNNKTNPLGGIHSSDAFRSMIERERARAERTGHVFSLVIFSSNGGGRNGNSLLERLGTLLVQKVRISDDVGWYEEKKSIGALLPGTSAEGAWKFIDVVMKKIEEDKSRLVCNVYTYPKLLNDSFRFIKEAENEHGSGSNHKSSMIATSSPTTKNNGKSSEAIEILVARPITLWKRMFDFFMALVLLILLSPLFLMISLFIKIVSPGPVFYRQKRIGCLGKPLTMWKFRTMHVNNNEEIHKKHIADVINKDTPVVKLDDHGDDRIILFGKFLRSTCLDELPQLLNVLRGDMSLIGPRPLLLYEADKLFQWQTRRYDIMPGMSGLWQVNGKNSTTFKQQIRYDIQYLRNVSPGLDAKILFCTVPTILRMVFNVISKKSAINQKTKTFFSSH